MAKASADAPLTEPHEAPPERRVADVIVETLRDLGVDTFYGIPGGAIAPIYDALVDAAAAADGRPLRVINTRHESGAVFMAAGHSTSGGSLPCVLVTSGPGITNALTGLASAKADGVPLIAIGGEVPKKNFGRGALQEGSRHGLDTIGMVRSVTKFSAAVVNPRSAANVVRRAVDTARSGRQGPVFLALPLDVAAERVVPTRMSAHVSTRFDVDEAAIAEAARTLQGAERGLILVGSGARHPMAVTQLRILAETLQIPVATTPKAKGLFPERSPLSVGIIGYGGHDSATRYLEAVPDVILAVGTGLGETSTNSWRAALEPSKFIQIDVDSSQIGRNYHVDLGLVGAAQEVLPRILAHLFSRPKVSTQPRLERRPYDPAAPGAPLHPAQVIESLQAVLPPDTIYSADIGEHLLFTLHYLRVQHPDGFLGHLGLGSMGSGIGSAIGAKVAHPDRAVVCVCGDYGFQMFGSELATCVEHGIGVVFAIFNDSRMRMVENGLSMLYGRSLIGGGPAVDYAAVARAYGADGVVIERAEDFALVTEERVRGGVPLVLDVRVDPGASFGVNARVKTIHTFGVPDED